MFTWQQILLCSEGLILKSLEDEVLAISLCFRIRDFVGVRAMLRVDMGGNSQKRLRETPVSAKQMGEI